MRRVCVTVLFLWMLSVTSVAIAENSRPFVPGSFDQLRAARTDEPFLLILWSITCVPCRDEFRLIADLRNSVGDFPLVLISTDSVDDLPIAEEMLAEFGLADIESWIFGHENEAKLRYEIDPSWYGEMPRSYFYDAAHRRRGISGSLERRQLLEWLRAL